MQEPQRGRARGLEDDLAACSPEMGLRDGKGSDAVCVQLRPAQVHNDSSGAAGDDAVNDPQEGCAVGNVEASQNDDLAAPDPPR